MNKIFIGIWLIFCSFNIYAQPADSTCHEIIDTQHEAHHNHVALFLGTTTFYNNGNNYFSLGLDYAYKSSSENHWAFSIFAEAIFADHTEYIIGIPVYHYIIGSWWFRAGPGMEIIQEEEHHGDEVTTKTKIEFLFRIGTGYPFHFGDFVLSPSVDIDFVRNNDALVWGLNFGYSF